MPNRFLRYGDQRYLITKEAEARLNRALDSVCLLYTSPSPRDS